MPEKSLYQQMLDDEREHAASHRQLFALALFQLSLLTVLLLLLILILINLIHGI
jgi:hypothetical protein